MELHEWKVYNSKDECIGRILTPTKNGHVASEKIYHRYGAKSYFLRKEYNGIKEI